MRELLSAHHALGRLEGTAALVVGGNVVATWAAGEAGAGRVLTPDTRMPIGSITKAITAAGVLTLVAEGRLELDAPIGRYLPDNLVAWGEVVTPRHCLAHTAGIPSLFKAHWGIPPATTEDVTSPISVDRLVAQFGHLPLRFAPGTSFEYSNSGYVLLAVAIEHTSGTPFHRYLETAVLLPAGTPRIEALRLDALEVTPRFGDQPAPVLDPSWQLGAGDLMASASDLARLHAHLPRTLPPPLGALLTAATTPSYGFGYRLGTRGGREVAWHEGVLPGVVATVHRALDRDVVAVVMSPRVRSPAHTSFARSWLNRVADQLVALGCGESPPDPPLPAYGPNAHERTALAGRYDVAERCVLVIDASEDGLRARAEGPWLLQGAPGEADPEERRVAEVAERAVTAIREGAWERVHALCSSVVRAVETPGSLAAAWAPTTAHLGALVGAHLILVSGPVACFRARFAHGADLDLRVSMDEDGRSVGGFYVVPVGDLPAVCTQTIRAAGVRLFSDGYADGVPDAWIDLDVATRRAVVTRKYC